MYTVFTQSYNDMIELQLTDDFYKPISMQDSKTIVPLYFRKAKWKASHAW